jgi:RNA polymerase sigma-70 factor (ECF subfamily)
MSIEEDELLARLRAGEEQAYRELVGACQGAMRAVARAIAGQRFADEVVQDAWLLTITANAARTRLRHGRGGARRAGTARLPGQDRRQSVGPAGQRAAAARAAGGLALEDICKVLDISLSNVRVLLHRARLKVFATLEHFEEAGQC